MKTAPLALLIAALALSAPTLAPAATQASGSALVAEAATAPHPLTRVALIGASLSAGTGNAVELELGKDAPLGTFVRSMLAASHADAEVFDFGSSYFFMNPRLKGAGQLNEALAKKPTAVIATDFLFWFGFGEAGPGDPRRVLGLRAGLELLERVECPLVVGDLPNIEHALEGKGPFGGPLVTRSMFPTEKERAEMNALIHAWADERSHVRVMPLSNLMNELKAGEPMEIEGNRWDVEGVEDALQKDLLHPSLRGSVWSAMVLGRAMTEWSGVSKADFEWDEKVIADRVWAATEDARAKRRASKERAEKRRLEREARRREAAGSGSGGR